MSLTKTNFRMMDGQVANVKDWGAVGDNVTDDHAAIQACMDANTVGIIFFPAGIYKVSDTLVIASSTQNLQGEGERSVIIAVTGAFVSDQPLISNPGIDGNPRKNQFIKGFSLYGSDVDMLGIGIDMDYTESAKVEDVWFQWLETRIHFGTNCFLNVFNNLKGSSTPEVAFHANKSGFNANVFTGCSIGGKGFLLELTDASGGMSGNAWVNCNFEGCIQDPAKNVNGAFSAINTTSGAISGIMGLSFSGCRWENNDASGIWLDAGGISGQSFNGIAGVSISGCFATGGANDNGNVNATSFLEATSVNGISMVGNHFDDYSVGVVGDFGGNQNWNFEGNSIGKGSGGLERIPALSNSGSLVGGAGGLVKNVGLLARREQHGLVPPTTGAHIQGDIVWNQQPQPGRYEKWICTVAGTPGSWLGVGYIQLENTYVPVLSGNTSGGWTMVVGGDVLGYARHGRLVHITGRLSIDAAQTPVGKLNLSLPWQVAIIDGQAAYANAPCTITGHTGTIVNPYFQMTEAETVAKLYDVSDAGAQTDVTATELGAPPFQIIVNLFYHAVDIA